MCCKNKNCPYLCPPFYTPTARLKTCQHSTRKMLSIVGEPDLLLQSYNVAYYTAGRKCTRVGFTNTYVASQPLSFLGPLEGTCISIRRLRSTTWSRSIYYYGTSLCTAVSEARRSLDRCLFLSRRRARRASLSRVRRSLSSSLRRRSWPKSHAHHCSKADIEG